MLKCYLVFLRTRESFDVPSEKIHALGELCSGMSYVLLAHEFGVNESTLYVKKDVFKGNTHNIRLWMH